MLRLGNSGISNASTNRLNPAEVDVFNWPYRPLDVPKPSGCRLTNRSDRVVIPLRVTVPKAGVANAIPRRVRQEFRGIPHPSVGAVDHRCRLQERAFARTIFPKTMAVMGYETSSLCPVQPRKPFTSSHWSRFGQPVPPDHFFESLRISLFTGIGSPQACRKRGMPRCRGAPQAYESRNNLST